MKAIPPRARARHLGAFGIMALVAVASPVIADVTCPTNLIFIPGGPTFVTSSVRSDSTSDTVRQTWGVSGYYDLGVGQWRATETGKSIEVATQDIFRVQGPPSPEPLTFRVRLQVDADPVIPPWDGHECRSAEYFVSLASGLDSVATFRSFTCFDATVHRGETLELTLRALPDDPFPLAIRIRAGSNRSVDVVLARLAILDLPGPWSVVSCQGFQAQAPTRTVRRTWGALKRGYR